MYLCLYLSVCISISISAYVRMYLCDYVCVCVSACVGVAEPETVCVCVRLFTTSVTSAHKNLRAVQQAGSPASGWQGGREDGGLGYNSIIKHLPEIICCFLNLRE